MAQLGNIGPWELILILLVALVVFGPNRLPEIGKALGKGTLEFKKALRMISEEDAPEAAEQERKVGQ